MQDDIHENIDNIVLHDDDQFSENACTVEDAASEMQDDVDNADEDIENIVLHEDGNIDLGRLISTEISGRCIVHFGHILTELQRLSTHWINECRLTDFVLNKIKRHGLKTQFFFQCRMCHFQDSIWSEPTVENILDINRGAVCGTMLTGTGHKQLQELLAAVDVPCMANETYQKYHHEMSEAFAAAAEEEMRVAGEQETKLAIERGDVINGTPHIPVITDDSWMKRSYRSGSYDSPSGSAIIMGYYSRKILYVGIRNKYCVVCARAAKLKVNVKEHVCYKNWGSNQSSTSMEGDIILEGFRYSLEMHGLIYSKYIGDGDSNVLKKLRDFPPYPNVVVEKIECTNHLLRNLSNRIREAGNTGGRNVSKLKKAVTNSVMKIRNAVVKAVTFRRNNKVSWQSKISGLIKDLHNIPSHVFGEHKDCASLKYFCNGELKEGEENLVPQLQMAGFYWKIENAMKRIIDNAESLLYKYTSNSVESCNSVICKFIGGKRIHFAKKGSYETRVKASVVQYNTSQTMSSACYAIGKEPPACTTKLENRNIVRRQYDEQVRAKKKLGLSVRNSKYSVKTGRADKDYGPNAERPDISDTMYEQLKSNHYEMLQTQQQNRDVLEYATRGQHENPQWHHVRRKLLTASNFGKICCRRKTTSCQNLVKSILYSPQLTNTAVEWGKRKEKLAREQLQEILGIEINDCGIFIDAEFPYLGATPDGIVGDNTIVEIKCPYAARQISPTDAMLNKVANVHRIFDKNDETRMNEKHAYYFQVQGQLHITQKKHCIFAVWTPFGIKYAIVNRDDTFWEVKMLPSLKRFYEDCLVPEIIDSRVARNMPIREPQYVIEAQKAAGKRKISLSD